MENTNYRALIESMVPPENVIGHLGNVLDMLLPIRGPRFLHVGPGEWPHEGDLGVEIADWMDKVAQQRPHLDAVLERDFKNRLSLVRVRSQHLLRDFWLLKTYHADFNRQNGIEVVDGPAAYVLMRIGGSGARVLYETAP